VIARPTTTKPSLIDMLAANRPSPQRNHALDAAAAQQARADGLPMISQKRRRGFKPNSHKR
jgi:hypothetical protein